MRELEKIAFKHKYRFNPSKRQFLEVVLCPYRGNGRLDREALEQFVETDRARIEGEEKVTLPLVLDKSKMDKNVQLPEKAFKHKDQTSTLKSRKEDEERLKREQEREELERHSSLAASVLRNKKSAYSLAAEDDLSWIGSKRKTYDIDLPAEGGSDQSGRRLRLPIDYD